MGDRAYIARMMSILFSLAVLQPVPHAEEVELLAPSEPFRMVVKPSPRLHLPALDKLPAAFAPLLTVSMLRCELTHNAKSEPCRTFMILEHSALELLNRGHKLEKR